MRFEPWGVVDRPAPDLPVERLRNGAPLDLASPRDTLPNFPYSLASGMCRGILGVSPWNDFCPRQNPMPLIRPFVFSESPTVGKFGRLSDICSENGSRQLVNGCPAHFLCPSDPFFVFEYLALGRVNDKSACLMGFRHAELFGLAGEVLWRNAEG